MVAQVRELGRQIDHVDKGPNRFRAIASWQKIMDRYGNRISPDDWLKTNRWIKNTFNMYEAAVARPGSVRYQDVEAFVVDHYGPELSESSNISAGFQETSEDTPVSAFFIHSRTKKAGDPDDFGNSAPALDYKKYGLDIDLVSELWSHLPPHVVGIVDGALLDGTPIRCLEISVQMAPGILEDLGTQSTSAPVKYARERIEEAVMFAEALGAQYGGLGERITAMTTHGRWIKERHPDMQITTGHNETTAALKNYVEAIAERKGLDLKESSITIVGANGSIGTAVIDALASEVGAIVLHDKESAEERLGVMAQRLEAENPHLGGKIQVFAGNDMLAQACQSSPIVVSAISESDVLLAEHFLPGTDLIDDSQPTAMSKHEVKRMLLQNGRVMWPTVAFPTGLRRRGIDYGLREGEWPCLVEVIAMQSSVGGQLETVGPVTKNRVEATEKVMGTLGFTLPKTFESFGQPQSG